MPLESPLLICTTARSGSNLLCDYLNHTRKVGTISEFFNPDIVRGGGFGKALSATDKVSLSAYIRHLKSTQAAPNGDWGAKLLYEDMESLLPLAAMRELFQGAKIVFLRRRNKLSQAVSYYLAQATGKWIATDRGHTPIEDVPFNFKKIDDCLRMLARQEAYWTSFFSYCELTALEVIHEDTIKDPETSLRRILSFADIQMDEIPVKTGLAEQKSTINAVFLRAYLAEKWNSTVASETVVYGGMSFTS